MTAYHLLLWDADLTLPSDEAALDNAMRITRQRFAQLWRGYQGSHPFITIDNARQILDGTQGFISQRVCESSDLRILILSHDELVHLKLTCTNADTPAFFPSGGLSASHAIPFEQIADHLTTTYLVFKISLVVNLLTDLHEDLHRSNGVDSVEAYGALRDQMYRFWSSIPEPGATP
jgi:hypothetical protein